jgi:hypothetical protein
MQSKILCGINSFVRGSAGVAGDCEIVGSAAPSDFSHRTRVWPTRGRPLKFTRC